MKSSGLSDTGRVRSNNEDTFTIEGPLLVVADGMGGAAAGEVASTMTVDIISRALEGSHPETDADRVSLLLRAIRQADTQVRAAAAQNREMAGMGTTLVGAYHVQDRLLIFHVGDSRAYIVSGGIDASAHVAPSPVDAGAATVILKKLDNPAEPPPSGGIRRLTEDHSVVMELVRAGVITEENIRSHPLRNRITRCVGSQGAVEPDFQWYDIRDGDALILCSDGLWEMVHEELILAVVKSSRTPEETCRKLVGAANDAGGHDNITVITAMFTV